MSNSIIMEIRAGVGGDEAGLFAGDLYRMYVRYAQKQGWKTQELSRTEGGLGDVREVVLKISGLGVWDKLKFESGVHRVQRVPHTEVKGRIHTSTATIAVLPEVATQEFDLNPNEIRTETFKASSHGGQNVQKVETAVRLIHIPTGVTASAQSERSQYHNKEEALRILRAKVYNLKMNAQKESMDSARREQIGLANRSEKIRTYNFPQDRLTDHRLNKSFHRLEAVMDGDIDKLLNLLQSSQASL